MCVCDAKGRERERERGREWKSKSYEIIHPRWPQKAFYAHKGRRFSVISVVLWLHFCLMGSRHRHTFSGLQQWWRCACFVNDVTRLLPLRPTDECQTAVETAGDADAALQRNIPCTLTSPVLETTLMLTIKIILISERRGDTINKIKRQKLRTTSNKRNGSGGFK